MVKINEILKLNGVEWKRVSKRGLDTLLTSALFSKKFKATIGATPCKANLNHPMIDLFKLEVTNENCLAGVKKWLNEVSYYNCNSELGNYLHYYVKVEVA